MSITFQRRPTFAVSTIFPTFHGHSKKCLDQHLVVSLSVEQCTTIKYESQDEDFGSDTPDLLYLSLSEDDEVVNTFSNE